MEKIFDPVRKKYVKLTPEEQVRQTIIRYLVEKLKYPLTHISVEKELSNYIKQRADIVVYNKKFEPKLIIECKAPTVKLNGKIFEQLLAYSSAANFEYLILTNGKEFIICKIQNNKCNFKQRNFPDFNSL